MLRGQEPGGTVVELPVPTGPMAVGRWTTALRDERRSESRTSDTTDRRAVVIDVWYPAAHGDALRLPYLDSAVTAMWERQFGLPPGFADRVVSHARGGAAITGGRRPVLIFSHGLSWPSVMYQAFLEDLASHGFVVVAVTHPYGAVVTLPDGRALPYAAIPAGLTDAARDSALADYVRTWAEDLRFVASQLPAIDGGSSPVAGHLDLDRVGVFGHSYGGSASALALDHPRIRAGLAMEGLVRDTMMRPFHVSRPFMHVIGGFNRAEMAGSQYRAGAGPYYEVVLDGVWHAMFSDLIFVYAHWADAAWHERHRWDLSPARGIHIMREILRAFFGRYLNGEDHPLLHPWSRESTEGTAMFPEMHLRIDVR
jgi:pimeloyl-ACP methyl ester carboxylesterase